MSFPKYGLKYKMQIDQNTLYFKNGPKISTLPFDFSCENMIDSIMKLLRERIDCGDKLFEKFTISLEQKNRKWISSLFVPLEVWLITFGERITKKIGKENFSGQIHYFSTDENISQFELIFENKFWSEVMIKINEIGKKNIKKIFMNFGLEGKNFTERTKGIYIVKF